MNLRAEVSEGRLTSRTTSTKLASSWTGTCPVSCAASTAVWVFVTILYEFGFLAADLPSERDQLSPASRRNELPRKDQLAVLVRVS